MRSSYSHHFHTGSPGCFNSMKTIFKNKSVAGVYREFFCGFEKNFRIRFAMLNLCIICNRIKKIL